MKLIRLALLLLLLLAGQTAAVAQGEYVPVVFEAKDLLTVGFNHAEVGITSPGVKYAELWTNPNSNPLLGALQLPGSQGFGARLVSTYLRIEDELNNVVKSNLPSQVTYYRGLLSGPIQIQANGDPLGRPNLARLNLSGFSYFARVVGQERYGPVTIECTIDVLLRSTSLSATYNFLTGEIVDTPDVQLNPASSINCETNLWFLFGVPEALVNLFASRVGEPAINARIRSAARAVIQGGTSTFDTFAGIAQLLEPGKYLVGGVDVGAYIRNNFSYVFSGSSNISLRLGDPRSFVTLNDNIDPGGGGSVERRYDRANLTILTGGQSLRVTYSWLGKYFYRWKCDSFVPSCSPP